jgi:UDP-N-acetylmuramate: L-alanyl-gamma-D-glutamyl-meso-diaminopimelate ligase
MGAVAGLLAQAGHDVRGSDTAVYPPMSDQLAALGVPVMQPYSAENLAWKPDSVVVGNVHGKDHVEVKAAQEMGIPLTSFPAILGEQLLSTKHSIVVTGTHGKTTTTSLIAHVLLEAGRDPSLFVGGVPIGLGHGYRLGKGEDFVIEGDEYDTAFFDKGSKFLHYRPRSVILTSVELDHVDIFPSIEAVRDTFKKLVELIPQDGLLVVAADSADALAIAKNAKCKVEPYIVLAPNEGTTFDGESDAGPPAGVTWWADHLEVGKSGRISFDVHRSTPGGAASSEKIERFETLLVGRHNVANCVAAIAICHARGLSVREIQLGISSFAGVRRRQELRGIAGGVTVLDDYGHHPTAVRETLKALRKRFPKRRLIAVYEPRSATSRRKTFQGEFAEAFAYADEVVIGELYDPSKIAPEDRFDPERLALDLHQRGTKAAYIPRVDLIVKHLAESAAPGDVVCVLSSGSFDGLHDKLLDAIGDAMRPAKLSDLPDIKEVLAVSDLASPVSDQQIGDYFTLRNENGLAGCIALEVHGDDAILHSLAVDVEYRGSGYGWMLADMAIQHARWRGVRRVYLLTEGASDFFAAKFGFRVVDRSTVSKGVSGSVMFQQIQVTSKAPLVAMRLDL